MVEVFVRLPTRGDGPYLSRRNRGDWQPDARTVLPPIVTDLRDGSYSPLDHLAQIGRAAEVAGLTGVLAPFDPHGEESVVVSASLLRASRWIRVAAEFHAAATTPVYAAKLSASLQRFSGGRLDWRLAVDLPATEARAVGDFVEGPQRYARADEFLTIAKGVWHEEGYTYEGRHFHVLAGGFAAPLTGQPFPRITLSGASEAAYDLSARHADIHLFGADDDIDTGVATLTAKAREHGREIRFGVELPVLVREDDDEASRAARRLWSGADRVTGLVGSYRTVADRVSDLAGRGIDVIVVEARPRLEETYRIGEHLLPLLAKENVHVG